jgi:long-chain fatty acid transport protein
MNKRKILFTALLIPAILAGGAASKANASGYAVFTQGASALGQGNAVTAHSDDPSTIFYNPALMNKLDGTQFSLGTTVIYSSHEFDSELTGQSTSNHSTFTPINFYATHKFNDKLSAGLGIFNPFGLGTQWNQDWQGRYIATKSELTTFNFNPVASYRVLPSLSVAAGVDVIKLDATLEQKIPSALFGFPGPDVNHKFDGDGTGVGFNLAAAYDVTNDITIGASYRSEVDIDVTGKSSTSLGVTPLDSKGKTSVTLPRQVTAGVAYHVTDPLILEAGLRWEGWSAFKELDLSLDSGFAVPPQQRKWHDTLGMNVGGKFRLNETVSLLAGYIYGSNAVPSYTFDPSIPDSDTHIFCFGSDLNFKPFKVGVSYAYQYYTDRNKNNQIGASPFDPSLSTAANGKYQSDAHLFAVNLGYKF